MNANCAHSVSDRRVAAVAPGYCPICLRLALQDRDALRDEARRLRDAIQIVLNSDATMGFKDIDTLLAALEET